MTLFARTMLDASTVVVPPAPVAHAFSTSISQNTTNNVMPISITGSYTSVTVSTGASHGTATVSGSTSILYTPSSGYSGADSFQYTATGPGGTSAPALASITVTFTPVVHTYISSSGTETVPIGASQCVITVWGDGGSGAFRTTGVQPSGGSGGAQAIKTIAVAGGDTMNYSVGMGGLFVGGASNFNGNAGFGSTVSGTVAGGSVSITANGGLGGLTTGVAVTGGTATGGDANTTGGTSAAAPGGGAGANGGAGGATAGTDGTPPGGGGAGTNNASSGLGASGAGARGQISFSYT